MRLYGTPPSHFTRKVRVLLAELRVPCEFVLLDQLMETGPEKFAQNPLHMFPVLEHEGRSLIESDLICDYLITRFGSGLFPRVEDVMDRQRLAMMNGGMSAGVTLIRSKRSGIEKWEDYAYFRQELAAIEGVLAWLDLDLGARTQYAVDTLTLLDISLMCFVEWAAFREFLKDWSRYPSLERFVHAHRDRPSFRATHPSLPVAKT